MLSKRFGVALGLAAAAAIGLNSIGAASAANINFSYSLVSAATVDASLISVSQSTGLAVYSPSTSASVTTSNGDVFTAAALNSGVLTAHNATSGLTFSASSYANGSQSSPSAGSSVGFNGRYGGFLNNNGSNVVPLTTGDTNYNTVLTNGYYSNDNSSEVVTLGGLKVGQAYTVEALVADTRSGAENSTGGRSMLFFNGNQSTVASGAYSQIADYPSGTQYQYSYGWGASSGTKNGSGTAGTTNYMALAVTGTFTATAATQTFGSQQFLTLTNPLTIGASQFNALLITPVVASPEPTTLALFSLAAAAGLLLLRRRAAH